MMSDDRDREAVSVRQAARILGCSENTVRALIHGGRLAAYRVGRVFRVPRDSLDTMRVAGGVRALERTLDERAKRFGERLTDWAPDTVSVTPPPGAPNGAGS